MRAIEHAHIGSHAHIAASILYLTRPLIHSYKSHGSGVAPWLRCQATPNLAWSQLWEVGFMVFLLGALCYTICTWRLLPRPWKGLGRSLHGPVQSQPGPGEEASWSSFGCSVLYNMALTMAFYHGIYHFMAFTEASSPGPSSRAWRGGFMVFLCCALYAPWRLLPRPFQGLERSLHGIYF